MRHPLIITHGSGKRAVGIWRPVGFFAGPCVSTITNLLVGTSVVGADVEGEVGRVTVRESQGLRTSSATALVGAATGNDATLDTVWGSQGLPRSSATRGKYAATGVALETLEVLCPDHGDSTSKTTRTRGLRVGGTRIGGRAPAAPRISAARTAFENVPVVRSAPHSAKTPPKAPSGRNRNTRLV